MKPPRILLLYTGLSAVAEVTQDPRVQNKAAEASEDRGRAGPHLFIVPMVSWEATRDAYADMHNSLNAIGAASRGAGA